MANDELYTPKHIFDALNVTFDLDVCAPKEGPLHTPANKWFSLEDDGLAKEWVGRVWMNPPFSESGKWVDRWLDHKNGICLIPFSKSRWFNRLWNSEVAILPAPSDIKFIKPDGKTHSIFMALAICGINEMNITALKMSGLGVIR